MKIFHTIFTVIFGTLILLLAIATILAFVAYELVKKSFKRI